MKNADLSEAKRTVQAQFGRTAKAYVESTSHGNREALEHLIEMMQPESTWTVLDIATGGGHVAGALAPCVNHVFATDITPKMLQTAREHLDGKQIKNVIFVVADAESLPFLNETFDAVTCRIAAHHFPNPRAFVSEVARVLKPSGTFVLVDNTVPEDAVLADFYNTLEKVRDESHVKCLSETEWMRLFEAENLDVKQSEVYPKLFQFDAWVRRMAKGESQVNRVAAFLMQGDEATRAFFKIAIENGKIQSFTGSEWAVKCMKR